MPQEILPGAVYTLQDTCHLLKISDATARRWIKRGVLTGRKLGRAYRFLGRDLLAALQHPDAPGWALPEEAESLSRIRA